MIVVDCPLALHRETGPGLLDSVYEVVLAHDLREQGLQVERQAPIPIELRGIRFEEGFRADILIENKVLLKLKSVEEVTKAHRKQVLTYLKLTGCKPGYLLNVVEALTKEGVSRIANGVAD